MALHWQYGLRMPLWACDLASCPDIDSPRCCSASAPLLLFYPHPRPHPHPYPYPYRYPYPYP